MFNIDHAKYQFKKIELKFMEKCRFQDLPKGGFFFFLIDDTKSILTLGSLSIGGHIFLGGLKMNFAHFSF